MPPFRFVRNLTRVTVVTSTSLSRNVSTLLVTSNIERSRHRDPFVPVVTVPPMSGPSLLLPGPFHYWWTSEDSSIHPSLYHLITSLVSLWPPVLRFLSTPSTFPLPLSIPQHHCFPLKSWKWIKPFQVKDEETYSSSFCLLCNPRDKIRDDDSPSSLGHCRRSSLIMSKSLCWDGHSFSLKGFLLSRGIAVDSVPSYCTEVGVHPSFQVDSSRRPPATQVLL